MSRFKTQFRACQRCGVYFPFRTKKEANNFKVCTECIEKAGYDFHFKKGNYEVFAYTEKMSNKELKHMISVCGRAAKSR